MHFVVLLVCHTPPTPTGLESISIYWAPVVCQIPCHSARCVGLVGNKTREVSTPMGLTFRREAKSKMISNGEETHKESRTALHDEGGQGLLLVAWPTCLAPGCWNQTCEGFVFIRENFAIARVPRWE